VSEKSLYLQIEFHKFVDLHDGSFVSASVAVIRSGKDSHNIPFVCPVVSIHHKLMSASDSSQAVRVVELFGNILAERVASTSWAYAPTASVIGVRPQQIADRAFVGHFLNAIELSNLVKSINAGRESSVQTENLFLNNCSQRKVVEEFCELLPDFSVAVLAQTLVVEAIPSRIN